MPKGKARFYRLQVTDQAHQLVVEFCVARTNEGVAAAEREGFVCHLMPKGFELDSAAEHLLESIEDHEEYAP